MSLHEAIVVKIPKIQPHPDPETTRLGIVMIDDYQVVVAKDQWKEGDLACYIEPDTMVPINREEFAFLKKNEDQTHHRVRVIRLRGQYSQGLLVPAPGHKVGDDLWKKLELERYEPKVHSGVKFSADTAGAPFGIIAPKYDLENWRKFGKVFEDGEEVYMTEKIHGTNSRFVFDGNKMHCGSRTRWVRDGDNPWWKCFHNNPEIEEVCRKNPGFVFYGEIYGYIQFLRYGHEPGTSSFALFDVLDGKTGDYLDGSEVFSGRFSPMKTVPVLYCGPYSRDKVLEHTDGKTKLMKKNAHIREGCVVKPTQETIVRIKGILKRKVLKSVSDKYLIKGDK